MIKQLALLPRYLSSQPRGALVTAVFFRVCACRHAAFSTEASENEPIEGYVYNPKREGGFCFSLLQIIAHGVEHTGLTPTVCQCHRDCPGCGGDMLDRCFLVG